VLKRGYGSGAWGLADRLSRANRLVIPDCGAAKRAAPITRHARQLLEKPP